MSAACRVFCIQSPENFFCAPCARQIAVLDFTWPCLSGTKVCNLVKRTKDQSDFDLLHVYLKHLLYNWRRKSGGYLISATSALKRKQSHIKHTSHYPDKTFNSVMISVRVRMCAPIEVQKEKKNRTNILIIRKFVRTVKVFLWKEIGQLNSPFQDINLPECVSIEPLRLAYISYTASRLLSRKYDPLTYQTQWTELVLLSGWKVRLCWCNLLYFKNLLVIPSFQRQSKRHWSNKPDKTTRL